MLKTALFSLILYYKGDTITSLKEAQDALIWIQGEIPYLDKYLNGEFSDWYNTVLKTQRRVIEVNEKCKIIFSYAKEKQTEIEDEWDKNENHI